MKIYILGKIGKLTHAEWLDRHNAALEIEREGNEPLNFADQPSISFEDNHLQLVNEISYLLEAEAVALLPDFINCQHASSLLMIATSLQYPIHPANGCKIPYRITFNLNI